MLAAAESAPAESTGSLRVWTGVFFLFAGLVLTLRAPLPFLEPEESRYAEIPRQMLAEGHLLVPYLDGRPYLDKPPLLYWLTLASYTVFGVNVAAARLVPLLAAWLTLLTVHEWMRRWAGPGEALAGALVLFLTGDYLYRGPMLTMNGLLALWTTLGLALGHAALHEENRPWRRWLASGLATGLGILTKGPVALALVGVPLGVWSLRGGIDGRKIRGLLLLLLASLGVAGPWFAAVAVRHPEFAEYFFWKHHVERFAAPFDHAKPFWFYLPQVLIGGLPWSLLALAECGRLARNWRRGEGRPGPFAVSAALWTLLLFSAAGSKRPVYLVPIWPLVAAATAARFREATAWDANGSWRPIAWRGGTLLLGLVLVGGSLFWLPRYTDRFSVPVAALERMEKEGLSGLPILCHPNVWLSVEFHLERRGIRVFDEEAWEELMEGIGAERDVIVVIENGRPLRKLRAGLPAARQVETLGASGLATVLRIRDADEEE